MASGENLWRTLGFPSGPWLLWLPILCLCISTASATMTVLVDDTYGDPVTGAIPQYSSCTPGLGCSGSARPSCPEAKEAYAGSWHECNASAITFSFTGSSFHVYFIQDSYHGVSSTIYLDGKAVGSVDILPTTPSVHNYTYNSTLFASNILSAGEHEVTIISAVPLLFDYAQYIKAPIAKPLIVQRGAAEDTRETPPGVIAGGTIAAVIGVVALSLTFYVTWRRRRTYINDDYDPPLPGPAPPRPWTNTPYNTMNTSMNLGNTIMSTMSEDTSHAHLVSKAHRERQDVMIISPTSEPGASPMEVEITSRRPSSRASEPHSARPLPPVPSPNAPAQPTRAASEPRRVRKLEPVRAQQQQMAQMRDQIAELQADGAMLSEEPRTPPPRYFRSSG